MNQQTRTSAGTSINSKKLPAVFNRFTFPAGSVVFDYGCGKYTDHIRAALPGVAYLPFDPFNQPDNVNRDSLAKLRLIPAFHPAAPIAIVCSNVLNVIDNDDVVAAIAAKLAELARSAGGVALVTVYEGDRSGTGRETGPDAWQRNQKLRDYLPLFPAGRARIYKNTIIVK